MRFINILFLTTFLPLAVYAQEFEVLPHIHGDPRGRLWLSEGLAQINGQNYSYGNRFRLGAELDLGPTRRFNLGLTIIDSIDSGERSREVGDVSRSASGLSLGYYLIPDRLRLTYTFHMQSLRGSRVTGSVGSNGHQLGLNYRFHSWDMVNLAAELSYLTVPSVTVPVFDINTNSTQSAAYPSAQIWTLSLILGFDFY